MSRPKCLRKTTVGWKLLVKWKDGSKQWIALNDLKKSHPIETAEFSEACGIDTEPAFIWWVPYMMIWKHTIILSAVKTRAQKM